MSMNLTAEEVDAIWIEAEQHCPPATSIDRLETIRNVPALLGSGYHREIELCPGLELRIFHETCREDLILQGTENQHLVQFKVLLSGVEDSEDFVLIDRKQGYIGGSGMQRCLKVSTPRSQPMIGVDVHLQPHLLNQLFAAPSGELPIELQPLVRGKDWQRAFSPKTTGTIRSIVQQIIDCPFLGLARRMYLQGKVFELMALQLEGIQEQGSAAPSRSFKADTLSRIQYAADILRSNLENPPSQTVLAQQVGVSDRTLRRGFQMLFGTTVWGYLTEQRLIQAEHLLRQGLSVAEVTHRSGYSNQGHFAAAFKRKFGITPKQWAMGKQWI